MALIFYARTLQTSLLIGLISLPIWLVLGYYSFKVFYLLLPVVSIIATVLLIFAMVYALRFAGEARERRFLRYVFSRYLSDEVVSEVLANPRGLGLGGAKRELTVLFSDIRNFTTLSEQLTPEEVVELLNAYFSRACPPIVQNRGRITNSSVTRSWRSLSPRCAREPRSQRTPGSHRDGGGRG